MKITEYVSPFFEEGAQKMELNIGIKHLNSVITVLILAEIEPFNQSHIRNKHC
jgi:hypothetical protein